MKLSEGPHFSGLSPPSRETESMVLAHASQRCRPSRGWRQSPGPAAMTGCEGNWRLSPNVVAGAGRREEGPLGFALWGGSGNGEFIHSGHRKLKRADDRAQRKMRVTTHIWGGGHWLETAVAQWNGFQGCSWCCPKFPRICEGENILPQLSR